MRTIKPTSKTNLRRAATFWRYFRTRPDYRYCSSSRTRKRRSAPSRSMCVWPYLWPASIWSASLNRVTWIAAGKEPQSIISWAKNRGRKSCLIWRAAPLCGLDPPSASGHDENGVRLLSNVDHSLAIVKWHFGWVEHEAFLRRTLGTIPVMRVFCISAWVSFSVV